MASIFPRENQKVKKVVFSNTVSFYKLTSSVPFTFFVIHTAHHFSEHDLILFSAILVYTCV